MIRVIDSLTATCRPWPRRHPCAFLLFAYFLLALLFGGELFLPGRSLYRWDTLLYNWPFTLEARAQILSGHMPFWASHFCCGTPLLGNINAGILYPLRLLTWVLPLRSGYQLFLFVHVWLSLAGMHLFLRKGLRLSGAAAFVGATAYAASGYARCMWDTHNFMPLPWIPIGLAALLLAREPRKRTWAILGAGLAWSMMILGGDFQAACLWVPAAMALSLVHPARRRLLPAALLAVGLGLLLTAPQWIPTYFTNLESYRAAGLSTAEATERSLHPARLAELVMPHLFGTREHWFAGEQIGDRFPWATSIHIGRLAFALAVLGICRWRKPAVRFGIALCIAAVLLSMGEYLPGFGFWLKLPVVGGFRYPEKYVLWLEFGLALLAAEGFSLVLPNVRFRTIAGAGRRLACSGGLLVLLAAAAATPLLVHFAASGEDTVSWLGFQWVMLVVLLAAVGLAWRARQRRPFAAVLAALVLADALLAWHMERPTSTRSRPLRPPAVATTIKNSDAPWGRYFKDPATRTIDFPPGYSLMSPAEGQAALQQSYMRFNTPRLWGLRTADGFSPLESGAMRARRMLLTDDERETDPTVAELAAFCRATGVRWLLTTQARAVSLQDEGLDWVLKQDWASDEGTILIRIKGTPEVDCPVAANASLSSVYNVWRQRPGRIRADLVPAHDAAEMTVRETYSCGWSARDQDGNVLALSPTEDGTMRVQVPPETNQVRLAYLAPGWHAGLAVGLIGLAAAFVLLLRAAGWARARAVLQHAGVATLCACLLFAAVGIAARSQWACTFDEGFHLTRGMRALHGDSRLSYFHPPLANVACAYFAELAHGSGLYLPDGPAWQAANVQSYSVDFTTANRRVFPDMVRASRNGTMLFVFLMMAALIGMASRIGGATAAWLTGLGLALNPAILAHGNLNTTDAAVTAMVLTGTAAAWAYARSGRTGHLALATLFFAASAATKFTGLLWLGTFLFICIPLFCVTRRTLKPLLMIIVGAALLVGFLVLLYGPDPQIIRGPEGTPLRGQAVIAGRYLEGLFLQTEHATSGQKAYFGGERFTQGSWWYMPAALILKTPTVCLLAGIAGLLAAAKNRPAKWIPWIPAIGFALILFFVNRLSIGVRHALPLQALLVTAGAVGCARIRGLRWRHIAVTLLAAGTAISAAAGFPYYISYFPVWAGGHLNGYRWMVDSNYDWGQDLERLEPHWAALTKSNNGTPPHLVYFGFVHPRIVYDMAMMAPSSCGFMHYDEKRSEGDDELARWSAALSREDQTTVISISSLELDPFTLDLAGFRNREPLGRIGHSFLVFGPAPDPSSAPSPPGQKP